MVSGPRPHRQAVAYLKALLGEVERKNGWQLAEDGGSAHPRTIQRVLDRSGWDADAVRDDLREQVIEEVGDGTVCWSSTRRAA